MTAISESIRECYYLKQYLPEQFIRISSRLRKWKLELTAILRPNQLNEFIVSHGAIVATCTQNLLDAKFDSD